MNKFLKIISSLFLILLFETSISCSQETKIKIGVLVPLSGENAFLGKQILNSIRMALQRAQRAGVLGLKIQVGGRLNGAEIARTEWTREGRVPLHTLRAEIDYATREANTTYGVLGIKVWVFKGEVLPKEEQTIPVGASPKRKASRRPQQFEDRSNENS